MNTENYNGRCLKAFRKGRKLTQKEFADRINVSDKTVSAWERGDRQLSAEVLTNIINEFEISFYDFFESISNDRSDPIFYICPKCSNVTITHKQSKIICCGIEASEIGANTEFNDCSVHTFVSENVLRVRVIHDMNASHYICFAAYVRKDGFDMLWLKPGVMPDMSFEFRGEGKLFVCCNVHGLTKIDINS